MTTRRSDLVDIEISRWYHCISRCVRAALLFCNENEDRKQWIEDRLESLNDNFAISVGSFAVMDSHLHVQCRLDPEESLLWSPEEVVRRWMAVYPPPRMAIDDPKVVKKWIKKQINKKGRVEVLRERLASLSWFMKALKEPLARMANKNDGCRGHFWEARFKSIAILDDEALLIDCAYIDLNPLAAGMAETPETSPYTSIKQRVAHVEGKGELECLEAALQGSVAGSKAAGDVEQDHWLIPIEDRRKETNADTVSNREGMLESFSLGSYLLLVDYTGRLYRDGKARMGSAVKDVFERLGTTGDSISGQVKTMLDSYQLRGNFFAANPATVRDLSERRGKRAVNLAPQLAG